MYSGVLVNFQWAVSKLDIQICSHAGLWKVVARVSVFVIQHVTINTLIVFKAVSQVSHFLVDVCRLIYKYYMRFFLFLDV